MLLALILAATPLAEATSHYADLDYEACVASLENVRAIPTRERARAELLLGLCHFALGQNARARAAVESALRRDATVGVPASASPKEVAFVEELRAAESGRPRRTPRKETAKTPEPSRAVEPETPKPEPLPVVLIPAPPEPAPPPAAPSTPPNTVPVSAVSTAAPQVVEPRATWLPWALGGLALAAGGTGVGLGVNARALETDARAAAVQVEAGRLQGEAQTSATAANVAFAVAGTAALAAVITFIVTR